MFSRILNRIDHLARRKKEDRVVQLREQLRKIVPSRNIFTTLIKRGSSNRCQTKKMILSWHKNVSKIEK